MQKQIKLREATQKDLRTLLEFEQGIIMAERPFDSTIRKGVVSYYDLKELMLNPKAMVLVACDGDIIVSSGYCVEKNARHYLNHESYAYLGFMYTLPTYRGKGINAMVMDGLRKWAYENDLTEIRLTVYEDNLPALRAYEKFGFKKHIVEMRLNTED